MSIPCSVAGQPKFVSIRRKKRKYCGHGLARGEGEAPATVSELSARELPLTASCKKLALSNPSTSGASSSSREHADHPTEPCCENAEDFQSKYSIINNKKLREVVREFARCASCGGSLDFVSDLAFTKGVCLKLALCCTVCGDARTVSDPHVDSKSLNAGTVIASKFCGFGSDYLRMFTSLVGLPTSLSAPAYGDHNKRLAGLSSEEASASYLSAALHLHSLHGVDPDEVIDVFVTLDRTWSRRGHVAHYGVVVVISWETGQVIDNDILNNCCRECVAHSQWDQSSEEYLLWHDNHNEACNQNFHGTSTSMEKEGALNLFARSVEKYKLRYTTVISDGDAKTVTALNELNEKTGPYGADHLIKKHECVGHVQKRLGKLLRDLRKNTPPIYGLRDDVKATKAAQVAANKAARIATKALVDAAKEAAAEANKKAKAEQAAERAMGRARGRGKRTTKTRLTLVKPAPVTRIVPEKVAPVMRTALLPMSGKGGLMDDHILHMQQYYGQAIRGNKGDVEAMKVACWAVFYHSASTDASPDHHCCPTGEDSWCKFNRALSLGEPPPPHRPRIPAHMQDIVKLVFTNHLCKETLLKRCELGATQNQNESFNSLVWERCHKIRFCSLDSVVVAVNLAVLTFNGGLKATAHLCKLFVGSLLENSAASLFASKDAIRLTKAVRKAEASTKEHRQALRSAAVILECSLAEDEGTTYVSGGGFD